MIDSKSRNISSYLAHVVCVGRVADSDTGISICMLPFAFLGPSPCLSATARPSAPPLGGRAEGGRASNAYICKTFAKIKPSTTLVTLPHPYFPHKCVFNN